MRRRYQKIEKQKESLIETEGYRFSRFQDAYGWRAYVESKDDGDFYLLAGPWKRKYSATNQIRSWTNDESLDF